LIKAVRERIRKNKTAKDAKLAAVTTELTKICRRIDEQKTALEGVYERKESTRSRLREVESLIETLGVQLEKQAKEMEHLEKEIRERPEEFKEAEEAENKRQETNNGETARPSRISLLRSLQ